MDPLSVLVHVAIHLYITAILGLLPGAARGVEGSCYFILPPHHVLAPVMEISFHGNKDMDLLVIKTHGSATGQELLFIVLRRGRKYFVIYRT